MVNNWLIKAEGTMVNEGGGKAATAGIQNTAARSETAGIVVLAWSGGAERFLWNGRNERRRQQNTIIGATTSTSTSTAATTSNGAASPATNGVEDGSTVAARTTTGVPTEAGGGTEYHSTGAKGWHCCPLSVAERLMAMNGTKEDEGFVLKNMFLNEIRAAGAGICERGRPISLVCHLVLTQVVLKE